MKKYVLLVETGCSWSLLHNDKLHKITAPTLEEIGCRLGRYFYGGEKPIRFYGLTRIKAGRRKNLTQDISVHFHYDPQIDGPKLVGLFAGKNRIITDMTSISAISKAYYYVIKIALKQAFDMKISDAMFRIKCWAIWPKTKAA